MNLMSILLITADFDRLIKFYEKISGLPATKLTPGFAALKTNVAILSIAEMQTTGGQKEIKRTENNSSILEFMVDDVDATYKKIADFLGDKIVLKPTTMPWGNRSLLFHDPDSNLVNFFSLGNPEAIK